MKKFTLSLILILSVLIVKADEGMWLLSLLNKNYEKMQEMGLTLSVEDIYSINNASMKDAVVIFGRGCTGEIISNQGLLLTNHHCGYGDIQALSTPENNILANGFWAKTLADEIPSEGLTATFFIRMEEVTDFILAGLNDDMSEQQRRDSISKRTQILQNEHNENNKYSVRIANMFNGNAFYMFIYQVYKDVRLVGVPPENMGKFGGETDNWTWPRHTADFALFRVYTDKDGNPATYSEENIPLVPKWYFPISTSGIKDGDFAMILGFPGSTDRFLTSYGVKMAIEKKNPTIVKVRDVKLASWRKFRESDPVIDLQYASKYAMISNYWKYYIGQTQQLINNNVIAKKEEVEDNFRVWVRRYERKELENVLEDIENAYKEISKFEMFTNLYNQAIFGGPEIFSLAAQYRSVYDLLQKQEKKTITDAEKKQLETRLTSLKSRLESFFKDYNVNVDKATTARLFELFYNETTPDQRPQAFNDAVKKSKNDFNKLTEDLFKKTMFIDKKAIEKFLQKPTTKALNNDLAFSWYVAFLNFYHDVIAPLAPQRENLSRANRLFVRGLLEMNPDMAPNANSQIRLTYGKVGGYPIKDGLIADYFTTLEGVIAKEDPNSREFIIPEKLKRLHKTKDYGQYAEDGRIRVNFLTDNDITGGNSGSPVINAKGELIGCAFDGNWEAMSGDIFFEPNLQRCINVDVRYILFIIDKFGDAKHLIDEMKIVND
ncbi:MAG: S46 family peptidase [Bacteroidetes bacterium]|nr:S46 family peptidase [Bacteroidota bacterium]MCL2302737.1 S46 family peptidase [Lentimicrobiaceae bacterium]